jgi:hypothetical protein
MNRERQTYKYSGSAVTLGDEGKEKKIEIIKNE